MQMIACLATPHVWIWWFRNDCFGGDWTPFSVFFFLSYTQICFFAGGWIFFVKQLFRDYEVRHVSVQLIFSATFSLSLTMFELIIFEIIGLLEQSSRYFHWRLELTLLLFMVVAVIPFYIAYSSISNIRFGKIWHFSPIFCFPMHFLYSRISYFAVPPRWIGPLTLSVWILFLYGFWRIGDPFPLLSVSHGVFTIEQVTFVNSLNPIYSVYSNVCSVFRRLCHASVWLELQLWPYWAVLVLSITHTQVWHISYGPSHKQMC